MRSRLKTVVVRTVAAVGFVTMSAPSAYAQLNTQHLKGSSGLKSGTQPPPNWYAIAPLLYIYNTDTVRDAEGRDIASSRTPNVTASVFGGGGLHITSHQIFGAHYGYQLLFPLGANKRLQANALDIEAGVGLTDSYFQPLNLGWHSTRADFVAGYGVFIPTGRFTAGAFDNTGFGMWGNELSFGTTYYLNDAKKYHAATLATLDIQSKKKDTDTKVGNTLNLEGGIGGDFMKGGLTMGLVYFATIKLTNDQISGLRVNQKSRVIGLGPEATLALAWGGKVHGFLRVNYQWEIYARTTTQGQQLFGTFTFAVPAIPIPTP